MTPIVVFARYRRHLLEAIEEAREIIGWARYKAWSDELLDARAVDDVTPVMMRFVEFTRQSRTEAEHEQA